MKPIKRKSRFDKSLKTILQTYPQIEGKLIDRINTFIRDRSNPTIRDHSLKGKMKGYRSFSVTCDIGTHNHVY